MRGSENAIPKSGCILVILIFNSPPNIYYCHDRLRNVPFASPTPGADWRLSDEDLP